MIHKRYLRALYGSLFSLLFISLIVFIFHFILEDSDAILSLWINWLVLIITGFILFAYIFFCYYTTKKHNPGLVILDYDKLNCFIVKTDVWFFKRLLIFDADGKYVGLTKMEINSFKSLLLSQLSYYKILVPIPYKIFDHEGNIVCIFKREGFKSAVVNIYNGHHECIGKVEFDEVRTLLKFSGHAFVGDNKYKISSKLFFEDTQSEIINLSSFNNRIEYHYIFRDISNEVAVLKEPISTDNGKVGLAVLAILYYLRGSSS